jgi:hypothetical protein
MHPTSARPSSTTCSGEGLQGRRASERGRHALLLAAACRELGPLGSHPSTCPRSRFLLTRPCFPFPLSLLSVPRAGRGRVRHGRRSGAPISAAAIATASSRRAPNHHRLELLHLFASLERRFPHRLCHRSAPPPWPPLPAELHSRQPIHPSTPPMFQSITATPPLPHADL